MVQYPNKHSFRRQLQAASFLQRKDEDLNAFSDEDELSSSDEVVNKEFDTKELILILQKTMNEVISKFLEQPAKTCRNKQHRKDLCEEKAMPPPKTACKTACKAACDCTPTHTMWSNCSMCPH